MRSVKEGTFIYTITFKMWTFTDNFSSFKENKDNANNPIIVEQVPSRLKTFRILKCELPITLIGHIDDIVIVCSALCNLKEPIYKY